MTAYFTADLRTADNAQFLAQLPDLIANGRRVDVDGSTVTITEESLGILAGFGDEDDGSYSDDQIWIGGRGYDVTPAAQGTVTVADLADAIAGRYDIPLAAALDLVRVHADQIADDTDMWNAGAEALTTSGSIVVTEAIAEGYKLDLNSTSEDLMLTELEDIKTKSAELDERRDELVRTLMSSSVARKRIAAAAGLSEPRLYQIRDGR